MTLEEIINTYLGLSEALNIYTKTRIMWRPRTISKSLVDHCMVTAFYYALWDSWGLELRC